MSLDVLLPVLFAVAAFLYASVGHAGASGYLVAMTLCGVAAAVMKPTALSLNLVVGTVALIAFARAGAFDWRRFWPFALGAVPFAYLGGGAAAGWWYKPLLAVVLVAAALKLVHETLPRAASVEVKPLRMPPILPAIAIGAGIGLLAGLTGTGGGIFLSPILLAMRWGEPRQTGGVAAAFILANSLAGLLGHQPDLATLPAELPLWAGIVLIGGALGATYGSRFAGSTAFKRCLAAVLLVAAGKLVL